jgi:ATP-dependent Clp protease ATP-binding subunit ClpA
MPPFSNFTTKAKEAIRKSHELAIERGQNHVNSVHLLAALVLQEESMVVSILDRLEVDTALLTDGILEVNESSCGSLQSKPISRMLPSPNCIYWRWTFRSISGREP